MKWMGQQWILGVPFDKSEWVGDNFIGSHHDESWFHQFAAKDVEIQRPLLLD